MIIQNYKLATCLRP